MSIYIAGPMSGYPDLNYPAFHRAAADLRAQGYVVVNPADHHDHETEQPWEWYIRKGLAALLTCDAIVLLPGWQNSRGARLERHVAEVLGMRIELYGACDVTALVGKCRCAHGGAVTG